MNFKNADEFLKDWFNSDAKTTVWFYIMGGREKEDDKGIPILDISLKHLSISRVDQDLYSINKEVYNVLSAMEKGIGVRQFLKERDEQIVNVHTVLV